MASTTQQAPTNLDRLPHKRTTSSVLKSIMAHRNHKRTPSTGEGLRRATTEQEVPPRPDMAKILPLLPPNHSDMKRPLSGVNQNGERTSSSPGKSIEVYDEERQRPAGLHKRTKSAISLKSLGGKDKECGLKQKNVDRQLEPKPKKSKSSTNLAGILSRPKSSKVSSKDAEKQVTDKENQTPPGSAEVEPPPIWAQFSSQPMGSIEDSITIPLVDKRSVDKEIALYTPRDYSPTKQRNFNGYQQPTLSRKTEPKPRPRSVYFTSDPTTTMISATVFGSHNLGSDRGDTTAPKTSIEENRRSPAHSRSSSKRSNIEERKVDTDTSKLGVAKVKRGSRVMAAVAAWNGKCKEPLVEAKEIILDAKAIENAFECLLEARNVPVVTRDKMRSLGTNIKADFINKHQLVPGSTSSTEGLSSKPGDAVAPRAEQLSGSNTMPSLEGLESVEAERGSPKKPRPRSRTFTFSKGDGSPSKKQKSDRTTSRERPKSIDLGPSVSSKSLTSAGTAQAQACYKTPSKVAVPEDFIKYLRKTQKPEDVEVGKLHKLRQLLRNETVIWVDTFITHGGMSEIVSLLNRIVQMEWREEHEDALLHETLLCLKALCTTSLALSRLSDIQSALFPMLLGMIFDEEKKGPSEFATRGIIMSLIFTHLSTSSSADLIPRAKIILSYLRDPTAPEEAQPPGFIASMHHPRPYRIWCKEVVNVTKEVFWIFLHAVNVIPYLDDPACSTSELSYTTRHFPASRPPVPAAPYVGGVEWDATNYLASHIDLLNGIIACLPTRDERNALRQELKDSGFEKCMGGSLRTCKEKLYGGVHAGLATWVSAGRADGWDVRSVREGPPRAEMVKTSPRKKKADEPPRLEMPRLDLGYRVEDKNSADEGSWL